jgi:hypothetical protein
MISKQIKMPMPSFKPIEEPVEVKVSEEKNTEAQPEEEKPADKPIEEKPVEVKPMEEKPADKPIEAPKPVEKKKPVVKLAHKKKTAAKEDKPVEKAEKAEAKESMPPKEEEKPATSDRGVEEKETTIPEVKVEAKKEHPKPQSVAQQKSTVDQGTGKQDAASYKELEEMSTFS